MLLLWQRFFSNYCFNSHALWKVLFEVYHLAIPEKDDNAVHSEIV